MPWSARTEAPLEAAAVVAAEHLNVFIRATLRTALLNNFLVRRPHVRCRLILQRVVKGNLFQRHTTVN